MKRILPFLFLAAICYGQNLPELGLVQDEAIYMTFDDGGFKDSSVYGHTGVQSNGATVAATVGVSAFLNLNYLQTQRVQLVEHAAFDFGTATPFTLMCWVNMLATTSANQVFMEKRDAAGNGFMWFHANATLRPRFFAENSSAQFCTCDVGSTSYIGAGWTHFAVAVTRGATCVNTAFQWYVNGVATTNVIIVNSTTPQADITSAADLFIGASRNLGTPAQGVNGYEDDVRMYKRILTAADVAVIYSETKGTHP